MRSAPRDRVPQENDDRVLEGLLRGGKGLPEGRDKHRPRETLQPVGEFAERRVAAGGGNVSRGFIKVHAACPEVQRLICAVRRCVRHARVHLPAARLWDVHASSADPGSARAPAPHPPRSPPSHEPALCLH